MMRALIAGTTFVFVALVFLVSTATAAAPEATTIAATVTQFGPAPDFQGIWQASGGVNDAGAFVETELHDTSSFVNSPVVVAFQAVLVFRGARGTITIAQQAHYAGGFPQGTWEIRSGTGIYEGLTGHGTFAFSPPNSLTFRGSTSRAG